MSIDKVYCKILSKIITEGKVKHNRTGIDTTSITGYMFEWDMSDGFPLLTTKKMAWKSLRVELEGFIRGITNKNWYKERGCNIWNEWCNPEIVPYGHDDETKQKMADERDLGPIYGFQWRHFNAKYYKDDTVYHGPSHCEEVDQLAWAINQLKTNPQSRRIIVSAWNPLQLDKMALVPCHYSFQLLCNDGVLDLIWNQRSCDTFLGIPFNIASYALLLELIAKECSMKTGKLIGFLGDVHIYHNHLDQIQKQLLREPYPTPTLELTNEGSIFDWTWDTANLIGYTCHGSLKAEVAV